MKKNVLLIEDHDDIASLIDMHLTDLGCQVVVANNGLDGLKQAELKTFDLVILDLMLPGMDGLELCRRIRKQTHYTPIVMLTSKSSELDRVLGLEIGADDYVTKPFSILEFIARVKSQFRRGEATLNIEKQDLSTLMRGDLYIDIDKRTIRIDNRHIDLTAKEFDLLLQFIRHPGRVYSRAQLLDMVWGYGHEGYEHTVNSHINRLRGKIEHDPNHPEYILTVWGVGYKFNDALSL